jgi:hypothetical protein
VTVLSLLLAAEAPLPVEFPPLPTDWIDAIGGVLLGVGTILVAVLAYRAQRQADAARRESELAQVTALEAQTQAANAQVDAMRYLADALNHNELHAGDDADAASDSDDADAASEPDDADAVSDSDDAQPAEPEPTGAGPGEPEPTVPGRSPAPRPGADVDAGRPTVPSTGRPRRPERPDRSHERRHRRPDVRWGAKLDGDRGFALTNVGTETAREVTVMAQNFGGPRRTPPSTHTIAEIAPGETTSIAEPVDAGAFARMLIVRWSEGDGIPHVERIVAA